MILHITVHNSTITVHNMILHISFQNLPIYTLKLRFILSYKRHFSCSLNEKRMYNFVLFNILKKIFFRHLVLVIYTIED